MISVPTFHVMGLMIKPDTQPIPITVLSGFLGSGKTTLLQNMLENKEGMKIAVVVNDVASVNIDSKLVASTTTPDTSANMDGMVELQNGCACCSLSDELLSSIRELVNMSDLRPEGEQFEHIVVELSGVADPKQIRAKFQDNSFMPLMERVELDTMVTMIDSAMFESYFESEKMASREETPELFYRDGEDPTEEKEDKEAEMLKDMPALWVEAVMSRRQDEQNAVSDLIVSQTETADLVVLNKLDLVSEKDVSRLSDIVQALKHPKAQVTTTSFGKIPIHDVLAIAKGKGVATAGRVDDHRDFVESVVDKTLEVESNDCNDPECTDPSHSHSHSHDNSDSHSHSHAHDCNDSECTDPSHSHNHEHNHDNSECTDPVCTDTSHSHSHEHSASSCNDPECTDTSHSHSHDHSASTRNDPDCTDTSHSHSHDHHPHGAIGTFVYSARLPFHPGRLVKFLNELPVVRGIPDAPDTEEGKLEISAEARSAINSCLRSKGFVWCAISHSGAFYWSHAGTSYQLTTLGRWWASLPRDEWPKNVDDVALSDFDFKDHDDITNPIGVGDRRQEIVFIGPNFGTPKYELLITEALNGCLLRDEEYEEYKSMQSTDFLLQSRFAGSPEKVGSV